MRYLVIALLVISCSKTQEKSVPLPKVSVATAVTKRIPVTIDAVGHFVALNSVKIKAQVEGTLVGIHFQDGQEVNEGDLLFTIDPRPYEAKRDQAVAERLQNLAKLQYSAEKVCRYRTLLPDNYVSQLDYIQYVSELANLEATVMKNEADIRLATVNLDYCYIKAPFKGITGLHFFDEGNLIGNDGSTLVIINQIDPIYLDFNIPERDFPKVAGRQNLDVLITYPDKATAKLVLINNQINPDTGMLFLRAQIDNPEHKFWADQFIKTKLVLYYKEDAVMVPEMAVNIGQKGRYVYVVQGGVAEYRSVKLGETVDGEIEVLEGVKAGEVVITNGQINVLPQAKVEI